MFCREGTFFFKLVFSGGKKSRYLFLPQVPFQSNHGDGMHEAVIYRPSHNPKTPFMRNRGKEENE